MEFLKKHFEKISLATALLVLIATGVYLAVKFGQLSSASHPPPRTGSPWPPIKLDALSNTIMALNYPAAWTNATLDIFNTSPLEIPHMDPGTNTNVVVVIQLKFVGIVRHPFKLRFVTYSFDEATNVGYNFQVNFIGFKRTFMVLKEGDIIQDRQVKTGYKAIKFVRKIIKVEDPTLGTRNVDQSRLTIQRGDEAPLDLPIGQDAEEQEPAAIVCCSGGQRYEVRKGQRLDCGGKTYIVVDINSREMLISHPEAEEKLIPIKLSPACD